MTTATLPRPIRSTIPARLDRLRWSPFHTRMVIGLGVAWILDGLEVTIASSVTGILSQADTLHLSTSQASAMGTVYLAGEVLGALLFGKLSDKLGRRPIFMWTLAVYLLGTGLTAFTAAGTGWLVYLYATRFIAGTGIGGEYSAINSAIDEMMPARYRGRTDIWINGSYWAGSILGTLLSFLLLNSLPADTGWRLAFLIGPVLAVVILFVRRNLPESPRWLITHGREQEALASIKHIEQSADRSLVLTRSSRWAMIRTASSCTPQTGTCLRSCPSPTVPTLPLGTGSPARRRRWTPTSGTRSWPST